MNFEPFLNKAKKIYYGEKNFQPKQQGEPRERTDAERIELLRNFVIKQVANGASIELQDDFSAVLVWGKKPNHILHLLLSLVTFGIWIIIWILVAMTSGETRRLYKIDKFGFIRY